MEITIQNLSKAYRGRVHALNGIDLRVQNGLFGLLGPNGAGKTTLMRILAGILLPTSGQATAGGHDMGASGGEPPSSVFSGIYRRSLAYIWICWRVNSWTTSDY